MLTAHRFIPAAKVALPDIFQFLGGPTTGANQDYFIATDTWVGKASVPTWDRHNTFTAAVGGKIYVIGGYSGSGVIQTVNECYDPATDTWTTKTAMPTGRAFGACAVVGGIIYCIGGNQAPTLVGVVEAYDPSTDSWSTKTSMLTARSDTACAVIGDKVYVVGGDTTVDVAINEMYDPSTDSWTAKASLPVTLRDMGAAASGGKLYAIGGNHAGSYQATNYCYDPRANSWTTKTSMTHARQSLAVVADPHTGLIYALSGYDGSSRNYNEVYNPATDSWTSKTGSVYNSEQGTAAVLPLSGGPFSDNFNRADSTTMINPASDGNNWIIYEGTWGINTNTGCKTGTAGAIAPFLSNPDGPGGFISGGYIGSETGATGAQTVTVDFKDTSGVPTMGVYLNFNPSVGSAYFLIVGNTSATLYRAGDFTAGSLSTLGTVTLTAWQGTGNVLGNGITTIQMHHDGAGTLKVYQDVGSGLTLKATITDPGTVLTGSQVLLESNVSPGNGISANFDNFTVTPY